jgi:hypothetical protein
VNERPSNSRATSRVPQEDELHLSGGDPLARRNLPELPGLLIRESRDACRFLWITKAPCGTSPIFIGMFQPCAPANLRNALTPVPVAQVVTPVLAVPAVAAITCDQLDEWRGAELGRARLERKRGRLGRDGD